MPIANRMAQLTKRYGQFDVELADIIVVLGGDGQMLQAMGLNKDNLHFWHELRPCYF